LLRSISPLGYHNHLLKGLPLFWSGGQSEASRRLCRPASSSAPEACGFPLYLLCNAWHVTLALLQFTRYPFFSFLKGGLGVCVWCVVCGVWTRFPCWKANLTFLFWVRRQDQGDLSARRRPEWCYCWVHTRFFENF
jgi:hypothetical protein